MLHILLSLVATLAALLLVAAILLVCGVIIGIIASFAQAFILKRK
jgi:hypothetical protein